MYVLTASAKADPSQQRGSPLMCKSGRSIIEKYATTDYAAALTWFKTVYFKKRKVELEENILAIFFFERFPNLLQEDFRVTSSKSIRVGCLQALIAKRRKEVATKVWTCLQDAIVNVTFPSVCRGGAGSMFAINHAHIKDFRFTDVSGCNGDLVKNLLVAMVENSTICSLLIDFHFDLTTSETTYVKLVSAASDLLARSATLKKVDLAFRDDLTTHAISVPHPCERSQLEDLRLTDIPVGNIRGLLLLNSLTMTNCDRSCDFSVPSRVMQRGPHSCLKPPTLRTILLS